MTKTGKSGRVCDDSTTWQQVDELERMHAQNVFSELFADSRRERVVSDGLVGLRIPHRSCVLKVHHGMFSIKVPSVQPPELANTKRGKVAGFSAASRKRMMEKLAQWRLKRRVYFVTLTYHEEWSRDWQGWKRDLDVLIKRIMRRFPDLEGLWRLEFQKRGAPHYHLIITDNHAEYDELKAVITQGWAEIAHENSEYQGKYATNIRPVNLVSRRHAMHYCAKYMAKVDSEHIDTATGEITQRETGRCWGTWGDIDTEPVIVHRVSPGQIEEFRAACIAMLKARKSRYADRFAELPRFKGFSLFGVGADAHEYSDTLDWREFGRLAYSFNSGNANAFDALSR